MTDSQGGSHPPNGSWQSDPTGRYKLRWQRSSGEWTDHVYSSEGALGSDSYDTPSPPPPLAEGATMREADSEPVRIKPGDFSAERSPARDKRAGRSDVHTPVLEQRVLLEAVEAAVTAMNAIGTAAKEMAERGDRKWARYFARAGERYADLTSDLIRLSRAVGECRKLPRPRVGAGASTRRRSGYRVVAKTARRLARS